jgi:hypothetical protein
MIELIEFLEKNKISLYGITLSRENLARIKKELMMRGINAA